MAEQVHPTMLVWVAILAAVELVPPPAWGGPGLSVAFAVQVAVAMLYPPAAAGAVAFFGAVQLRGRRPLAAAWWDHSQALVVTAAGSGVFHALASVHDPWRRLLPGYGAAAALMWLAGAAGTVLRTRTPLREALARMNAASPYRFPATFPGMGWFGLPAARLYLAEGLWPVVILLGLLVYARTTCLKAWHQRGELAALLEREQRAAAELRRLDQAKGQFVAVAAHEVRTPLTAILGYVAILRRWPANDPVTTDRYLGIVERQANRLLGLADSLLTAARLEHGGLAAVFRWTSVEEVCKEVVEGLGDDRARVRLDLAPDLPQVSTDGRCLGQVLGNLLDNALKYSPPPDPCELGVRQEADQLVCWVRDQGAGIPRPELDRIFDRFYQVDGSDSRPAAGVGLGLSLVRELVDALGGTISVDSQLGRGSRFTVTLPIRSPTRAEGGDALRRGR